jgi:hypothetical protein
MKQLHAIGVVVAGLAVTVVAVRAQSAAPPHDTFYFIGEINKASIAAWRSEADAVGRGDAACGRR